MSPRVLRSNTAEVKILLRSETIEVKILSRSIQFRSKFSTEIKIFLKPVLHRGQNRNAVIDQSMQIIQFGTTSPKRKICILLLFVADFGFS